VENTSEITKVATSGKPQPRRNFVEVLIEFNSMAPEAFESALYKYIIKA
jgi:hypothetical protein